MAHFLVIYRPPRATFNEDATAAEEQIIGTHFQYLKRLLAGGKLLLAGPCEDASMGLAVIECGSLDEARSILAADPAIQGKVFTGEVKPYRVSLFRRESRT